MKANYETLSVNKILYIIIHNLNFLTLPRIFISYLTDNSVIFTI